MVTIKSNPAPFFVQWNIKDEKSGTLQQINANADEYKGTSNSFPRPMLVVKHNKSLENYSFRIEVENLIGFTEKVIPGKTFNDSVIMSLVQNFSINKSNHHSILTLLKMIITLDQGIILFQNIWLFYTLLRINFLGDSYENCRKTLKRPNIKLLCQTIKIMSWFCIIYRVPDCAIAIWYLYTFMCTLISKLAYYD